MVDDKLYRANQNYDISLRVLTPDSEEIGDETTLRIISGQEHCVLVVLPDDRTFIEELRSALKIEKPYFKYKKKCELCGYIAGGNTGINATSGKINSSFHCPDCGNNQKIQIETVRQ